FPVAVFCSATVLLVAFSTGTLASAVEVGSVGGVNEETGEVGRSMIDWVLVPAATVLVEILKPVQAFSPVDALSTGRSIPWWDVVRAFAQIVLLLGGVVALFGMGVFNYRELARSHTNA
ncbi:MAG TPA: hypothetical protein VK530_19345, partial [Candidatus Acidoferrum sp.]|nr:hypothetical protein [Candidatus Acidoferrum sp.]